MSTYALLHTCSGYWLQRDFTEPPGSVHMSPSPADRFNSSTPSKWRRRRRRWRFIGPPCRYTPAVEMRTDRARLPFYPRAHYRSDRPINSRWIDRSAGEVSRNEWPVNERAAAFASYWSPGPARRYRGRESRADTTREHACPSHEATATHRNPRRH